MANEYFKNKFGCKIYKISLDGGMSCPNRDKNKNGGCIFCSQGGSGDFAEGQCDNIDVQIERAIKRVQNKNPLGYIAYYQSYSNTYAPIEYLEKVFYPTINHSKIKGLSIATRPDCINQDTLQLLDKLNKIKPVFVELGLQTSNDQIAEFFNRGYKTAVFENAVTSLKKIGINVIAHVIIGLPKSELKDELNTVDYLVNCKVDGIKFHLLHVLKNTKLEGLYLQGNYIPLSCKQYVDRLIECVKKVPDNVVIHRLTGDAPKKILVAPLWSGDKKHVLNTINKRFLLNDLHRLQ